MNRIKILIVEPAEVVVEGLSSFLGNQPRFAVLSPAFGTERLTERIVGAHPDVIVVNPTLVDNPGTLRDDAPQAAVVALVYQYVEPWRLKAYDAVIDIRMSRASIVETLADAVQNEQKAEIAGTEGTAYEVSRRETDVLVLVAKGLTNKEIAEQLSVSVHTVISHRKNIMHTTGIKSVAGLTVYAMLNNLIDDTTLV